MVFRFRGFRVSVSVRVSVPPEASWAHRQVQRSLSLSLVLNWVPEWARLLIRPAVPLKFSA